MSQAKRLSLAGEALLRPDQDLAQLYLTHNNVSVKTQILGGFSTYLRGAKVAATQDRPAEEHVGARQASNVLAPVISQTVANFRSLTYNLGFQHQSGFLHKPSP